jgi:hypothetical protein
VLERTGLAVEAAVVPIGARNSSNFRDTALAAVVQNTAFAAVEGAPWSNMMDIRAVVVMVVESVEVISKPI